MTDMTVSETLNKAADLIEERGWSQGTMGWGGDGRELCLEGGILAAMGFDHFVCMGAEAFWACPAYKAVADYLNLSDERDDEDLLADPAWRWNDRPERTAEEVIAALRAAGVIAESREPATEAATR